MKTLADRIEALIPNGDGYNSDYANTLAEAAEAIRNKYPLPDDLYPDSKDWRAHSAQFAKGEKCPNTLETAQAAWARDQEIIFEQKAEIARLKGKINKLNQEPARVTLEKALELLRDIHTCLAQGEAIYPNSLYEQDIYRLVSKHD